MRARACSFSFMSAWMYAWVDLVLSWPSQSARTAMSTPACSRLIAVEGRRGGGEIFFVARDGQVLAAIARYFVRRASMASGDRGLTSPEGEWAAAVRPWVTAITRL